MRNFNIEGENKFFFFIRHSFFCLLIDLFSFLTSLFIKKLYGNIILWLCVVATLMYLSKLKVLYKRNTEYLEAKETFEDGKNEFAKLFQKTFIRFFLPILIVGFILNLAIFHNLLVNILLLLLGYLFFFIYINIKLMDILLAKRKKWRF
jgi:hypothetical protein